MEKIKKWVLNFNTILVVFAALAVLVSFQRYMPAATFNGHFTYYNNFILFKNSVLHLLQHKDMYAPYENEGAWDLYKYSPTFAVFMLPIAFLPDLPGLIIWNLAGVLLVYFAVKKLPMLTDNQKQWMLWFVLPELILSTQSSQSNAHMVALYLLTFTAFENNKITQAVIYTCIATCIKPYGLMIASLFLFYPGKLKFIYTSILSGVLFLALPLLITSFENLSFQYNSWFTMMAGDYSDSTGLSVMSLVNDISGSPINKMPVILAGTILTFSLLLFPSKYKDSSFRLQFVALTLLWVVIFNHKSESPTFIIPVVGVALWFFGTPYTKWNLALLLIVLIFTQLSASDLFPPYVRKEIFARIHIKVIPCFLLWCIILGRFYLNSFQPPSPQKSTHL